LILSGASKFKLNAKGLGQMAEPFFFPSQYIAAIQKPGHRLMNFGTDQGLKFLKFLNKTPCV
jgi:hypothetical protein